jgi:hypothetical protein
MQYGPQLCLGLPGPDGLAQLGDTGFSRSQRCDNALHLVDRLDGAGHFNGFLCVDEPQSLCLECDGRTGIQALKSNSRSAAQQMGDLVGRNPPPRRAHAQRSAARRLRS